MTDSFALVLPCYNEARSLPAVVERALDCARRRGLTPAEFQLVLVDNGSGDDSRAVMQALAEKRGGEFLHIVSVAANRGYGHGVMTGLRAARPGMLAWSHADEQCDPEDAFRAWKMLRDAGPGVLVKGNRLGRPLRERILSRGFEVASALLLGARLHEINAQPKVFASELLGALVTPPDDFAFDLYVLLRARDLAYTIREIDVRFPPRRHGSSHWSSTLRSRVRTIARLLAYLMAQRRRRCAARRP
jgi:glycosyltransferase involved in cell wall biosynthesis